MESSMEGGYPPPLRYCHFLHNLNQYLFLFVIGLGFLATYIAPAVLNKLAWYANPLFNVAIELSSILLTIMPMGLAVVTTVFIADVYINRVANALTWRRIMGTTWRRLPYRVKFFVIALMVGIFVLGVFNSLIYNFGFDVPADITSFAYTHSIDLPGPLLAKLAVAINNVILAIIATMDAVFAIVMTVLFVDLRIIPFAVAAALFATSLFASVMTITSLLNISMIAYIAFALALPAFRVAVWFYDRRYVKDVRC